MKNEMMRAALLHGLKDLNVEDVAKPQIGAGDVLVKIETATTCGTDLKIFQRGYIDRIIQLPTLFGHEWSGKVVEVGEALSWPKKGMRIRAGNSAPCFQCRMCQRGRYNLCENMIWLWGAYAEYIRVPTRMIFVNTMEIPAHVSYEEASLAEPLACVLHGAEEATISLGDTVAIIGAGPIGLLHLLMARKLGAGSIIMSDLVDERLQHAEELGADETIDARNEDTIAAVKRLTKGYGADVVIEATGLQSTWEQALSMVANGGTVLEFGGCPPGSEIKVNTDLLHYGEVTVRGAFHAKPIHFKRALDLIASGTINVKPLITDRKPLESIREAFLKLATSKADLKIAIKP